MVHEYISIFLPFFWFVNIHKCFVPYLAKKNIDIIYIYIPARGQWSLLLVKVLQTPPGGSKLYFVVFKSPKEIKRIYIFMLKTSAFAKQRELN